MSSITATVTEKKHTFCHQNTTTQASDSSKRIVTRSRKKATTYQQGDFIHALALLLSNTMQYK